MSKDLQFGFVSLYFLEIYCVVENALGLIFLHCGMALGWIYPTSSSLL